MVARSEHNLQGSIGVAGSIQKSGALLRRQFQRSFQQIANLLPAFPGHDSGLLNRGAARFLLSTIFAALRQVRVRVVVKEV
jgi:hypothetical protein